jgi:molybdopterin-containing oxidoreductase family iron-sulfur binding subunit
MKSVNLPLVNENAEPPRFWRSVDELNDRGVREVIEREFPEQAGFLTDDVSRRKFLSLMGASLALAGVGGCGRQAPDKIVPRVKQPENTIPGQPKFYATAMPMPGGATGLVVESHEGRPTKIEGNPDHPASRGASGIFAQAAILDLYDPDRAKTVIHNGQIIGWDDALLALRSELHSIVSRQGQGLAILIGVDSSPTLTKQLAQLCLKYLPQAKLYFHEPTTSDHLGHANRIAFADDLDFVFHFDKADVVVALDSDFTATGPMHVRYAREFAARRNPDGRMNRLYALESMPTPTGLVADHRWPLSPSQLVRFAYQLAALLGVGKGQPADRLDPYVECIAKDLKDAAGRSIVIAGPYQPIEVQLLVHAINHKLGNFGKTITPIQTDRLSPKPNLIGDLCADINSNKIDALIFLGGNPVYSSAADLQFETLCKKVSLRIGLSLYDDETADLCHWHFPQTHFLEEWSDAAATDGSMSIIQPLIAPLYGNRNVHEFVAELIRIGRDHSPKDDEEKPPIETRPLAIIQDHWREWFSSQQPTVSFDRQWREWVRSGVIAMPTRSVPALELKTNWDQSLPDKTKFENASGIELVLRPDPTIFDGRFANNAWLQELPKPVTKLVWENAAIMSPAMAKELGVSMHEGPHGGSHGELITELVELTYRGRTVVAPVYVLPGHADKCITMHFGYGRTKAGKVGTGLGVNAYALQTSDAPWGGPGLEVKRTGKSYTLGCTQSQHSMHGRDLVRLATISEFAKDPSVKPKDGHHHPAGGHNPHVEGFESPPPEFYTNPQTKPPYQWGMSVDLGKCNGCQACVIACQAENSIPVVGKDLVTRGRVMHWMRIDRYFTGDENNPQAVHQPVMCQHCENAPCEVVCPVEATTHSPDGLNEMTYNRCVGTRYCANNCPYKVRRFNFLEYVDYATESLKLQRNPDVSVRVRGVMEKCTYCVQRIREAEITAKVQRRGIRDGDVVTACQQACPTEAIIFGNILDDKSRVHGRKKLPRDYGILTELNTKPRTTYLAAIRNPNPEIG